MGERIVVAVVFQYALCLRRLVVSLLLVVQGIVGRGYGVCPPSVEIRLLAHVELVYTSGSDGRDAVEPLPRFPGEYVAFGYRGVVHGDFQLGVIVGYAQVARDGKQLLCRSVVARVEIPSVEQVVGLDVAVVHTVDLEHRQSFVNVGPRLVEITSGVGEGIGVEHHGVGTPHGVLAKVLALQFHHAFQDWRGLGGLAFLIHGHDQVGKAVRLHREPPVHWWRGIVGRQLFGLRVIPQLVVARAHPYLAVPRAAAFRWQGQGVDGVAPREQVDGILVLAFVVEAYALGKYRVRLLGLGSRHHAGDKKENCRQEDFSHIFIYEGYVFYETFDNRLIVYRRCLVARESSSWLHRKLPLPPLPPRPSPVAARILSWRGSLG